MRLPGPRLPSRRYPNRSPRSNLRRRSRHRVWQIHHLQTQHHLLRRPRALRDRESPRQQSGAEWGACIRGRRSRRGPQRILERSELARLRLAPHRAGESYRRTISSAWEIGASPVYDRTPSRTSRQAAVRERQRHRKEVARPSPAAPPQAARTWAANVLGDPRPRPSTARRCRRSGQVREAERCHCPDLQRSRRERLDARPGNTQRCKSRARGLSGVLCWLRPLGA